MKRILLLTIILIRVWGAAFAASHLCVLSTTCELQKHFITVTEMPRLGWQMKADRNGEKQSAYEIEVRKKKKKKTVYKTGKIRQRRFIILLGKNQEIAHMFHNRSINGSNDSLL